MLFYLKPLEWRRMIANFIGPGITVLYIGRPTYKKTHPITFFLDCQFNFVMDSFFTSSIEDIKRVIQQSHHFYSWLGILERI